MTIERFTRDEFEQVLGKIHPGFESLGLVKGEYVYAVPVYSHVRVLVRSSIDSTEIAADTGQDSIRVYAEHLDSKPSLIEKWYPLGKKLQAYTTRVSGWQDRLEKQVRTLFERAAQVHRPATECPECGAYLRAFLVKKEGRNHGRPFASCKKCNHFEWLDTPYPNGSTATFEVPESELSHEQHNQKKTSELATEQESDFDLSGTIFDFDTNEQDEIDEQSDDFKPSEYQQDIFHFVRSESGHAIINACAGSGKTTTNIRAIDYVDPSLRTVFLAFNRHIASELRERGVQTAMTFHSLGRAAIVRSLPHAKFNQYKMYNIIDEMVKDDTILDEQVSYEQKSTISRLVSLLKGNLLEPTYLNVEEMIDNFDSISVELDQYEWYCKATIDAYKRSVATSAEYDFDDMIFWPATKLHSVTTEKYDVVFVDECQDLNKAQIELAQNLLSDRGRMILIGDPYQSIYAFRGAFIGIMQYMQHTLNAHELPLSISYRAPKAVGRLINRLFPEIAFEVADNAKEGKVYSCKHDEFVNNVTANDGVICRTNAPLVKPCFELIRQGRKATILGRDIGKGLIALVNKRSELKRIQKIADPRERFSALLVELAEYEREQRERLTERGKHGRAAMIADQVATIFAIADECSTKDELVKAIKSTFDDQAEGVVFSTVHKAKGLEWDRVFVLRADLMPHPMAKDADALQQERNIKYVAFTRAKDELVLVEKEK